MALIAQRLQVWWEGTKNRARSISVLSRGTRSLPNSHVGIIYYNFFFFQRWTVDRKHGRKRKSLKSCGPTWRRGAHGTSTSRSFHTSLFFSTSLWLCSFVFTCLPCALVSAIPACKKLDFLCVKWSIYRWEHAPQMGWSTRATWAIGTLKLWNMDIVLQQIDGRWIKLKKSRK